MDPKELINDIKNNKVKKIRVINENKLKIDFGRIIGEVKNMMVHHRKILLGE